MQFEKSFIETEEGKRFLTTRTKTDLLRYARDHYGIQWKDAIRHLKEANFEGWNPALWFDYLNVLREHWPYLKEARAEEARRQKMLRQERNLLMSLAGSLVWKEYLPGQWHWEGSEEAFAAKHRLEAERREREIKKLRTRTLPPLK